MNIETIKKLYEGICEAHIDGDSVYFIFDKSALATPDIFKELLLRISEAYDNPSRFVKILKKHGIDKFVMLSIKYCFEIMDGVYTDDNKPKDHGDCCLGTEDGIRFFIRIEHK